MTLAEFLEKANKTHGNTYNYSLVTEEAVCSKYVKIICPAHGIISQYIYNHVKGHGCKWCAFETNAKNQARSQEEFIKAAKKVHGNTYDYSLAVYHSRKTAITIICRLHGKFTQLAGTHISGHGCNKCAIEERAAKTRYSLEDFINLSRSSHQIKYDYSLVKFTNFKDKITIVCPIHGKFRQTVGEHAGGAGCNKCAKIKSSNALRSNTSEFVEKAQLIYGDKYDYSLVNYSTCDNKVDIICPIHGVFSQSPYNHLHGHECSRCGMREGRNKINIKLPEIIKRSISVHKNKYDYSKAKQPNSTGEKICIICPIHGEFWQMVNSHMDGSGCPKCAKNISHNEKRIYNFLDSHNITYESQYKFKDCRDKNRLPFDCAVFGSNQKLKYLIEYDGEQHYFAIQRSHDKKKNEQKFKNTIYHDAIKTRYCKEHEIELIRIPYWDKDKIEDILSNLK
jgi:hypothetical protein